MGLLRVTKSHSPDRLSTFQNVYIDPKSLLLALMPGACVAMAIGKAIDD
jgi:hypothetical protein